MLKMCAEAAAAALAAARWTQPIVDNALHVVANAFDDAQLGAAAAAKAAVAIARSTAVRAAIHAGSARPQAEGAADPALASPDGETRPFARHVAFPDGGRFAVRGRTCRW